MDILTIVFGEKNDVRLFKFLHLRFFFSQRRVCIASTSTDAQSLPLPPLTSSVWHFVYSYWLSWEYVKNICSSDFVYKYPVSHSFGILLNDSLISSPSNYAVSYACV